MKAKNVSKSVAKPVSDDSDMDEYKAKDDARTLTQAAEIQGDPDRHTRAAKHLETQATAASSAHDAARKQLEKKTKKRMGKVFGGDKDSTFEGTKDKEDTDTEKVVNEKD